MELRFAGRDQLAHLAGCEPFVCQTTQESLLIGSIPDPFAREIGFMIPIQQCNGLAEIVEALKRLLEVLVGFHGSKEPLPTAGCPVVTGNRLGILATLTPFVQPHCEDDHNADDDFLHVGRPVHLTGSTFKHSHDQGSQNGSDDTS